MRELTIISQSLPVVEANFDEVKKDLQEQLEQYKSLVVTDESLSVCKAHQKGLAGLKNKIDTYRKDIKKVMSEPIVAFEDKCKQLVSLVESVEQPLKDGIKVFDDVKREEKRQVALKIITETIVKHDLKPKYAEQLVVLDKYTNLTAKQSDVTEDIEQRCFILLGEQKKEEELLGLIQDAVDTVNKTIKKQLSMSGYQMFIDRGLSTKDIIQRINSDAAMIWEAENPKTVEVVEQVVEQPNPVKVICPVAEIPKQEDPLWFVTMEVTATTSQFALLKQFMLDNQITYKAIEKKVVA